MSEIIDNLRSDLNDVIKDIQYQNSRLDTCPVSDKDYIMEVISDDYEDLMDIQHHLYTEIYKEILLKTEGYLKRNNLKAMVLGISGGLDSTVAAFICREISDRNPDIKFVAVSLPSKTNGTEENNIADLIVDNLGDIKIKHNIQDVYESFNTMLNADNNANSIQLGNIKARIRMITLYHYASLYNGVVIDTDNLTEHYLGFYTIHGDVGDLAPISELWKTEVYDLGHYIKNSLVLAKSDVEQEILSKALEIKPTDGNGLGCDMDQIAPGYSYTEVDAVLKWMFNADDVRTRSVIAKQYFNGDETMVERIKDRFERTQFKRRALPHKIIF